MSLSQNKFLPDSPLERISAELEQAQRILVVSHIRPDGDAVGSVLGMGLALANKGKQVQMVLSDGIPLEFKFLEGSRAISRKVKAEFDYSIVVDCSDIKRIGKILNDRQPDLNIDHHITNLNFGRINLIDGSAAATSEILTIYLPEWGLPIGNTAARALLAGIISDTIGFRTSNVTTRTLQKAAELVEIGADLAYIYDQVLLRRPFAAVRYWQQGLAKLQQTNSVIWTTLTLEDRRTASYSGNDDADLINVLSTVNEGKISIVFVEQKNGNVKVSWRAQPGYDVSQIALQFGGGGHPAASGAEIHGTLEEIKNQVLEATLSLIS